MSDVEDVDGAVDKLRWENVGERQALLAELAKPARLRSLLERLRTDRALLELCEFEASCYKMVVVARPSTVRVRLHLFCDDSRTRAAHDDGRAWPASLGYSDSPHSHRWSFTSRIFSGCYTHSIYGKEHEFESAADPRTIAPKVIREEDQGTTYSLEHDLVHSLSAPANTVSLFIRGPALKARSLIVDPNSPKLDWRRTAKEESAELRKAQRFSLDMLDRCMQTLAELKVV